MRQLLLLPAIFSVGLLHASADDAQVIRELIPCESAMMRADFDRLATSPSTLKPADVEDKSLTLMLFAQMKVEKGQTTEQQEQFRYLLGDRPVMPKPSDLAKEMCRDRRTGKRRIVLAPVTYIHGDRITDCTCNVDGDVATGTVSFKVPRLYQGEVDYVARRLEGNWFIVEFIMSAYKIHIIRGDDGMWKEKSARSGSN